MLRSTIMLTVFLVLPSIAYGASFEFVVPDGVVHAGDTVHVPVYINTQESGTLVAQPDLSFSEKMLWVRSFTFAPGWLPVVGEEYQLLDNGRGVLRRTAGFEGSVSGRVFFGTITGIARGEGVGSLSVSDRSFILNDNNEDILRERHSAQWEVKTRSTGSNAPLELFDIHLDLEGETFTMKDPVVARVFFQSFGRVPTPVDMFFTVTDEYGNVIASSEENIVVETEAVFTKRFENLDLSRGDYILHVITRYNAGVEDSFTKPFSVVLSKRLWWAFGAVGIGVICVGAFGAVFFIRRKKISNINEPKNTI